MPEKLIFKGFLMSTEMSTNETKTDKISGLSSMSLLSLSG